MYNDSLRYKIMEQVQIGNMFSNTCIDFIQQQELIQKYNNDKKSTERKTIRRYLLKTIKMFVLRT